MTLKWLSAAAQEIHPTKVLFVKQVTFAAWIWSKKVVMIIKQNLRQVDFDISWIKCIDLKFKL